MGAAVALTPQAHDGEPGGDARRTKAMRAAGELRMFKNTIPEPGNRVLLKDGKVGTVTAKAERAEYQRRYRAAHKAKIAEYQRRYYAAHKAERTEYQRRYDAAHKAERAENQRRYYAAHKAQTEGERES